MVSGMVNDINANNSTWADLPANRIKGQPKLEKIRRVSEALQDYIGPGC